MLVAARSAGRRGGGNAARSAAAAPRGPQQQAADGWLGRWPRRLLAAITSCTQLRYVEVSHYGPFECSKEHESDASAQQAGQALAELRQLESLVVAEHLEPAHPEPSAQRVFPLGGDGDGEDDVGAPGAGRDSASAAERARAAARHFAMLAAAAPGLSNLRHLCMPGCALPDAAVGDLVAALRCMPELQSLNLEDHDLREHGATELAQVLPEAVPRLRDVDIRSRFKFKEKSGATMALCAAFGRLLWLRRVDLGGASLTDSSGSGAAIFESLGQCPALLTMSIYTVAPLDAKTVQVWRAELQRGGFAQLLQLALSMHATGNATAVAVCKKRCSAMCTAWAEACRESVSLLTDAHRDAEAPAYTLARPYREERREQHEVVNQCMAHSIRGGER